MILPRGLVLLRKEAGLTSFQALRPLKKALGKAKVGHTGTLDSFASGLLVILVGSYARLTPWFSALGKSYRALVRLGEETDTLDPEGRVVASAPPPSREAFEAALGGFRGPILQAPPAFSALHIDGKRAYERALAGEEVEMKPRPVTIHRLELEDFSESGATLLVECSSGTYIRSLARDIARACGSRARLEKLERLSVGPFRLEAAVGGADFDPESHLRPLLPEAAAAFGFSPCLLTEGLERAFANGQRIESAALKPLWPEPGPASAVAPAAGSEPCVGAAAEACPAAVFGASGAFLGLVDPSARFLEYRLVLPEAS